MSYISNLEHSKYSFELSQSLWRSYWTLHISWCAIPLDLCLKISKPQRLQLHRRSFLRRVCLVKKHSWQHFKQHSLRWDLCCQPRLPHSKLQPRRRHGAENSSKSQCRQRPVHHWRLIRFGNGSYNLGHRCKCCYKSCGLNTNAGTWTWSAAWVPNPGATDRNVN